MFSHLLSLTLEALKMAKSSHCAETTHCSKAALRFKELHIVYVLSQEYGILTNMLEEMQC